MTVRSYPLGVVRQLSQAELCDLAHDEEGFIQAYTQFLYAPLPGNKSVLNPSPFPLWGWVITSALSLEEKKTCLLRMAKVDEQFDPSVSIGLRLVNVGCQRELPWLADMGLERLPAYPEKDAYLSAIKYCLSLDVVLAKVFFDMWAAHNPSLLPVLDEMLPVKTCTISSLNAYRLKNKMFESIATPSKASGPRVM